MTRLLGLVTIVGCASHEPPTREEAPAPEVVLAPARVDPPRPSAPVVRAPQAWARVGGGLGHDDAVAVAVASDGAVWRSAAWTSRGNSLASSPMSTCR